jgi:threonine dehydrogenase-like Zn-dependent dehydrogenase
MKTKAIRIHDKEDLRLDTFELPEIADNEILARVICDSICMSSYKAAKQGTDHKRVPDNIKEYPAMIGHEFSGELVKIGKKWQEKFHEGQKFSIQPAINYESGPVGVLSAPGYSYRYIGGDATYIIIPNEVMEQDCLLPYHGNGFYPAALAEPLSCVIGAMHANYHTEPGSYQHKMEIVDQGNMALLAGVGPMGLALINYTIHRKTQKPENLIVTDINQARLDRAEDLYSTEEAAKNGISLKYVNTSKMNDPVKELKEMVNGKGFDDVFVFAPVPAVIEQGDDLLAWDGCLNFFAGPADPNFKVKFNFYDIHYNATHIVGTSGGNNDDMREAIEYMSEGLDPAGLVTHIGGLNAVVDTTLNLPDISGGKKLIYTHLDMELTALEDFEKLGQSDPLFKELSGIINKNKGLWSVEAENYLLEHARRI